MKHVQPVLLQQFLAGEADLTEQDSISEHLAECEECSALLAALASDDEALSVALRLDGDELAWITAQDLTAPVLRKLAWYREPSLIILASLAILPGIWLLSATGKLLVNMLATEGPMDTTIKIGALLASALWELVIYLSKGGLLAQIWPVLLLVGGFWLGRRFVKKEDKTHA